jgi:hypothetical protein
MSKVQRNSQQAMAELLRGSGARTTADRPNRLILPEGLHDRILATVEQSQDGRERSVGFSHLGDAWVTGKLKVGGVGHVSTNHPYFFRPHIRMHTHPKPDMEKEDMAMRAMGVMRGWSADKTAKMMDASRCSYEGYYMLPSGSDVALIYPKSNGVIGSMIASEGGIFFSLRKRLTDTESITVSNLTDGREAASEYDAKISEAVNMYLSTEDTTAFVLNAAAKALNHKYTIYFGQDLENPELTRVGPAK